MGRPVPSHAAGGIALIGVACPLAAAVLSAVSIRTGFDVVFATVVVVVVVVVLLAMVALILVTLAFLVAS